MKSLQLLKAIVVDSSFPFKFNVAVVFTTAFIMGRESFINRVARRYVIPEDEFLEEIEKLRKDCAEIRKRRMEYEANRSRQMEFQANK